MSPDFQERYTRLLTQYLLSPDKGSLEDARRLGKEMLEAGYGIAEVGELHAQVLDHLARTHPDSPIGQERSQVPLLELLLPWEMVINAYDQELERQQAALRASEERYRLIVERSHAGILVIDEAHLITYANDQLCQLLDCPRQEIVGRDFRRFLDDESRELVNDRYRRRQRGEEVPPRYEFNIVRPDGEKRRVEISAAVMQDSAGRVRTVGQILDITERKKAEDALRRTNDYLENLIATANVMIVGLDADGQIVLFNRFAQELTGYSREDLEGKNWFDVLVPRERYPQVWAEFQRLLAGGMPIELENPILTKSGEERLIVWRNSPVHEGDTWVGTLSFGLDITDRKRAEEALRKSEQFLAAIFESIQDGISILDPDLTIRHVNGVMKRWYAQNLPLEGKKCFECYHNRTAPCDPCPTLDCMQSRETERAIVPGLEGSAVEWIELFSYPMLDPASGEVTGVVEFVRDITERKQAEETQRLLSQENAALLSISQDLNRLDLEALLRTIGERAKALFEADGSRVFLLEPDGRTLRCVLALHEHAKALLGKKFKLGQGITGAIAARGEPEIVDDISVDPRLMRVPGLPVEEKARMFAPLRERGRLLGVISVSRPGKERPFQAADLELFKALAGMASTAISNARLYEAERAARKRAERLQAAAQALSSTLDLQQVLNLILSELRQVVPYDSASVQRLEGNRLEIIGGSGFPNLEDLLGVSFDLAAGDNPNCEVIRRREPLILNDVRTTSYEAFQRQPHAQARIRSWLGVPLLFGDRPTGMITLDKQEPGFYTEEHTRLAQAFATQAAIAIENAELYKQAERRIQELAALHETALDISSRLEMRQLLNAIIARACDLLGATGGLVFLHDADRDRLVAVTSYHLEKDYAGLTLQVGEGAAGVAFQRRQPLILADYRAWDGKSPQVADAEARAMLAVPMRWHEQIIGVLDVIDNGRVGAFDEQDLALLLPFATQAATAIRNAQLYEEIQRNNRELTLINRIITASAAAAGMDVTAVLEIVCGELGRYFDVPQAAAALLNDEKTEGRVVAEYRAEGRPSGLGAIIPVPGNPSMEYLLRHRAPLAVDDAQSDARLAPIHELMRQRGTVSLLLLPLVVEGEVVGSLGLDAVEPRHFTADEVALAQRVADQVSGVLARARLEEARQRLSAAVEQAAEAVVVTDAEGTILYVNPAFEAITGYPRAEAVGQNPRILKSGKQDAAFYEQLWQTISSGQVWRGQFVNRRKDGRLYTEQATISPIFDQDQEIINYVAVKHDISRELQLEEQFRQAQKMEAVGRLAGGVAHDFNNVLTVIHLSARLLERELHPQDPLLVHVQRIREAGQRATNLTKQLLTFSRKEIVEPQRLDLNQVVREMSRMLGRIIGEDVELVLDLADDLWPLYIDPTQMEQVIMNLVVNARDAMPQGGRLTVRTANATLDETHTAQHVEAQPGEYVLLTISDTGIGMDDEVKSHIFEPFFTTKGPGKGTGLGLATVHGIVKQNQGHIEVRSEPGQGTSLDIYLPRSPRVAEPPHLLPEIENQAPAASDGGQTILIVEDEGDVLSLAAQILKTHGYRVLTAADGPQALLIGQAHKDPIHLLITDVIMPQMDGSTLAQQLCAQRPEMRVLYVSGYADERISQHGVLEAGATFLGKPFSVEGLIDKVRKVLASEA